MTIVVVGGGPTGVELSGAIAELARTVLKRDFRRIDPSHAHIIVVEASPTVLSQFPADLAASATRQLEHLGVKVRGSTKVKRLRKGEVELDDGEIIRAENIFWTAGVSATPLTGKLGVEIDKGGRVKVNQFKRAGTSGGLRDRRHGLRSCRKTAVRCRAYRRRPCRWDDTLARCIESDLVHRARPEPFSYFDKGTMATIGRSKAVAYFGKVKIRGWLAWISWLFVHLIFLSGLSQ